MNVLFLTGVASNRYGGPLSWTRRLAETLREMGHRVYILTWGPADATTLGSRPFDRGPQGRPGPSDQEDHPYPVAQADGPYSWWGADAHRAEPPAALRRVPLVGFWAVLAAAARDGRRLLQRDRIDVIHTQTVYEAFSASWARGAGRLPLVLTLHGDYVTEQDERWKSHWRRRLHLPLERAGLRACQAVTTSSAWLRHRLAGPLRGRRVEIIPNGIALPAAGRVWPTRAALDLPVDRPIVLCLNSLHAPYRRRALDLLVQAAPRVIDQVPDVLFLVAGGVNDPHRDRELVDWARQQAAGLPFRFTGYRQQPPQDLMDAADLYVHPSFLDNSPTAVLEAMALAKPIVATRIGGIPELVVDGETGLLCPTEPSALAEAMVRLLRDRPLAQGLGLAARQAAQTTFSWDKIGERFVELYHQIGERAHTPMGEGL